MFDSFLGLIIVLVILGGIASALWWVFAIWAGIKLFQAATRRSIS